ncbi:MAG: hypothetical protein GY940_32775, partial [bacterium]|nr:hypothetical protein [bacterium]
VKSTSAFASSLDTTHAQKFSQDLSASSLMRTKIVPVPPPAVLVERINILLDQLKGEAEVEEAEQGLLGTITLNDAIQAFLSEDPLIDKAIPVALKDPLRKIPDVEIETDDKISAADETDVWFIKGENSAYRLKKAGNELKVYKELKEEEKKGIDEIILDKVADKLLGVPQDI